MQSGLLIGELAKRAGVSVDTVRYYERERLLPRARRTEGGFRVFTLEAVERLQFIKQAQAIGLSLDEIRELLGSEGEAAECKRMRDLLKSKLAELDERLEALRDFRRRLTQHLAACETELERHGAAARCPVILQITDSNSRRSRNR
jgi:DNA-binding transcriptional MerR regulator